MSETSMRAKVIEALRSLDAISVENAVMPGTPDVEFIGGWVELKYVPTWPKRVGTALAVPHFTPIQRAWLRRRIRRGGKAWLLLRVDRDWMLFRGDVAADILGQSSKDELLVQAEIAWSEPPSNDELLKALRQ